MNVDHVKKAQAFQSMSGDVKTTYQAWHAAVFDEKASPFDKKMMELIALSASAVMRCHYCVESHSYKARKAGATPEEIAKVIQIASVVGAGATISYGVEGLDVPKK